MQESAAGPRFDSKSKQEAGTQGCAPTRARFRSQSVPSGERPPDQDLGLASPLGVIIWGAVRQRSATEARYGMSGRSTSVTGLVWHGSNLRLWASTGAQPRK